MTVQGPVKKQQPDGMSHRGGAPTHPPTPPPEKEPWYTLSYKPPVTRSVLNFLTQKCALLHTLLTGALWTAVRAHQSPYCESDGETDEHIAWDCPTWSAARTDTTHTLGLAGNIPVPDQRKSA